MRTLVPLGQIAGVCIASALLVRLAGGSLWSALAGACVSTCLGALLVALLTPPDDPDS